MISLTDWFLEKFRLIDEDEIIEEYEEPSKYDISWIDSIGKEKRYDRHIFYKNICSYADAKEVLDKYKMGAICVIKTNPMINSDAQGMLNYICGGVYVLEGKVNEVGLNVFTVTHK